jgi:cardiolipin synthase
MEAMFVEDLGSATEIVLDARNRVRTPSATRAATEPAGGAGSGGGSSGRAMAGALRIGNAVTAAITNRRVLEPVESHIALIAGTILLALAILAVTVPRGFAYPLAAIILWLALALVYRGFRLHTRHDDRQ